MWANGKEQIKVSSDSLLSVVVIYAVSTLLCQEGEAWAMYLSANLTLVICNAKEALHEQILFRLMKANSHSLLTLTYYHYH